MTEAEYYKLLCELGLLDDTEDWELYQQQEARYNDYEYKSELEEVGYA